MKRKLLIEYLKSHDCIFLNHGKKHDIFVNKMTGKKTTVPRHNDIDEELVDAICKQFGIPKKR